MSLIYPPSTNAIQKTLDAQLLSGTTASMTLNNVTGIQDKAGVCVIDAVDTTGTSTPSKREYVYFTGVSGVTLTGLTRNADSGGSDQDHAVGAIVQFVPDVLLIQALIDALLTVVTTAGVLDTTKVTDLSTAQTLTNKTLTSPKLNEDVALTATSTELNLLDDVTALVTTSSTDTFTNKRITKRSGTTESSATPTINTDNYDFYSITAQTEDITSFTTNLSGTPTAGQTLWIAITGTAARAITWGTSFEASAAVALPTTTVTTARLDVGFVWNTVTSKWRCVAAS